MRKSFGRKLAAAMMVMVMAILVLPYCTKASAAEKSGSITLSIEKYDKDTGKVKFFVTPTKVEFTSGQTGEDLLSDVIGKENIALSYGFVDSLTLDGTVYGADFSTCTSWSVYKNNEPDTVGVSEYVPTKGDVYRIILTQYDAETYCFPTMTTNMDALYTAIANNTENANYSSAVKLAKSAPSQEEVDAMVKTLTTKQTLKLTKTKATVKVGKKVAIKATANPAGTITYKSNNKKIATVTSKGVVKGKKVGTTTIKVSLNGVTKKFKVTVK